MRKILFISILVAITTVINAQTTVPAGNVSGTWALGGSPYNVTGHIIVPTGDSLIIAPGVTVNFQGHYKFNVQGKVKAIGTVADTIVFTAVNTTSGWWGIRFDQTPTTQDSSIFKYCKVHYGKANGTGNDGSGGGLFLNGFSKIRIENSRITNNSSTNYYGGGGIFCTSSSPNIKNNTIKNNSATSYGWGGGIFCDNSSPNIINNTISNNSANLNTNIYCSYSSPNILNNIINGLTYLGSNSSPYINGNNIVGGIVIYVNSPTYPIITNNTISNSSGISCSVSCPTISNNTIINNTGSGISCSNSASVHISNNTINNNTGSGISCSNSAFYISNNIINNNSNGGINCTGYYNSAIDSITNNTISNNSATNGGGIYCSSSSPIYIENNTISNNTATLSGGGICSSNANITGNTINNNSAALGGGICIYATTNPNIISNKVFNNTSSSSGGGIYCQGSPNLINNAIFNNTAPKGGGFYFISSTSIIINCTVSNNLANGIGTTNGGGGIFCSGVSNPVLKNTILWGNIATTGNGNSVYIDYPGNASFSYCNVEGGSSGIYYANYIYTGSYTNNINVNPLFVSPSGGAGTAFNGVTANWRLQATSLCIDAGIPDTTGLNIPALDLAGNARVSVCRIDIGAYEFQKGLAPVVDAGTNQNICIGQSATFTVTTSGGTTSPYNYVWSGGLGTNATVTVSPTTTTMYYVSVNDNGGCTFKDSVLVTVKINSTSATSLAASPTTICSGASVTLTKTGGTLGTDANWNWYEGTCGGTYIKSGVNLTVTPTISSSYYLRAESVCDTTTCVSTTVLVNTSSTSATSAVATPPFACANSSTTLSVTGGNLGTGAIWYWYSIACGGTLEGVNNPTSLMPTSNTTYFVRAESACNTTACVSVSVEISTLSTPATSAITTNATICSGASTTLFLTGGTLGTGGSWNWYSGSCGNIYLISGIMITASPTTTTTYYVRAESYCNTTTCVSVMIEVSTTSTIPLSANSANGTICTGGATTLNIIGGTLGSSANWNWYIGTCGNSYLISGINPVVNPSTTITYYVRAENSCNTTLCVSTTIIVNSPSTAASSISATFTTICDGSTTNLSLTGGSLGTGAFWYWYSGACGGTLEAFNTSTIQSPSITTTYFARAESLCNTTTCVSKTIIVNSSSILATSLTATPSTINIGQYTSLTQTGGILGVGANWYWYTGSCGGTFIKSGLSLTQNPIVTTTYYVRADGTCNITTCLSTTVTVTAIVTTSYMISGNFTYDNSVSTSLDSLWVYLMLNGNKVDSIQSDANGYYQFINLSNGTYNVTATTHKAWGGVNITDAIKCKLHFAGSQLLTSSIRLHAGDVNNSLLINPTDGVNMIRRFAGADTSFDRGDWIFEKPYGGDSINVSTYMNDTVIVNGANVVQDFKGLCIGDVNGSYNPIPVGQKSLMRKVRTVILEEISNRK